MKPGPAGCLKQGRGRPKLFVKFESVKRVMAVKGVGLKT